MFILKKFLYCWQDPLAFFVDDVKMIMSEGNQREKKFTSDEQP